MRPIWRLRRFAACDDAVRQQVGGEQPFALTKAPLPRHYVGAHGVRLIWGLRRFVARDDAVVGHWICLSALIVHWQMAAMVSNPRQKPFPHVW